MNWRFEGKYINGVYVGKLNGTISGLNCPKMTNISWSEYDPSNNPAPTICMKKNVFSDETILHIRNLSEQGIKNTEIKSKYYPNIPLGTISDIITKKIHSNI